MPTGGNLVLICATRSHVKVIIIKIRYRTTEAESRSNKLTVILNNQICYDYFVSLAVKETKKKRINLYVRKDLLYLALMGEGTN